MSSTYTLTHTIQRIAAQNKTKSKHQTREQSWTLFHVSVYVCVYAIDFVYHFHFIPLSHFAFKLSLSITRIILIVFPVTAITTRSLSLILFFCKI